MILNCKMTLSPWLKAQLDEQSTFLIANNQGSKTKFYNYSNAFDSPPSHTRNARKRSVDLRAQDRTSSRRSSHTMNAANPSSLQNLHPSSEALVPRPSSPVTNTVDHHTRACERLIKAADTEALHFHLYTLQSDAQGIYEGDVVERPDTFDEDLFQRLSGKEVTVQEVMSQVLGAYGPAGTTLLHGACACKRADAVPILVSFGADPNARNHRNVSPAQICVEQSDSATCEALRDAGGCLTVDEAKEMENKGGKPLDRRLVNILIGGNGLETANSSSTSDMTSDNTQSTSQLHMTRRNSAVAGAGAAGMTIHTDPKMAEYAKVVLAQVPKTVPANAGEKQISRWLERLVKYGEKEDIGRFLDSMTTPDRVYYTGAFGYSKSTLLFTAAWNRRVDMIEFLIDTYKIDPTLRNVRKHTALTMCLEQGESEGVQMLLQYGVSVTEKEVREVEQRTGKPVDSVSAELVHEHCKLKKICSVFESNKEVREKDREKTKRREAWRADIHKELERIVKFGDEAKIRELIDGLSPGLREAQLGPVGQTKSSLLFTAAWNKRSDMCRILCEYKADVNHRNVRKNAAICMAIEQNDVDCVTSLLECGADSSSTECREIEKRTGKQIDDKIYEAIFDFCNK
jgi:ankyrin repeat protein